MRKASEVTSREPPLNFPFRLVHCVDRKRKGRRVLSDIDLSDVTTASKAGYRVRLLLPSPGRHRLTEKVRCVPYSSQPLEKADRELKH